MCHVEMSGVDYAGLGYLQLHHMDMQSKDNF